ncbi:sugar transferase [Pseudoflavonifractor sp. P01025]|uniref:sugar transferase n=1 Tax=Flintibacter porci TaxID=3342383 RepID=UPI0035B661D2
MDAAIVERESRQTENMSVAEPLQFPEIQGQSACFKVIIPEIRISRLYLFAKRTFDVVMSLVVLALLAIPMLIIALLIRIDSPGPALFRQERLGKDGRPFTIFKFRSMRVDAEKNGPQWADKDDPRCTKLGRILRKSRLDEIPQLWNILKGEMSFVGPRPERACFYEKFETYIHGFSKRLLVKPGLTGYAQVNGGYELKPEEKIVYDIEYIQKQSVLMDLWCIFKTVKLVFTHEGAR